MLVFKFGLFQHFHYKTDHCAPCQQCTKTALKGKTIKNLNFVFFHIFVKMGGNQAWSILRNRGKKLIRYDSVPIQFRLESIRYEIRKSRNITENFDSISDFIYACFQKNRCYFDIIEI
jgi:hypothetical protein